MFGGFGMTELIVILIIVLLLFGTKKLKTLGGDLGSAIKGFRKAMDHEEDAKNIEDQGQDTLTTATLDSTEGVTPETNSKS